MSAAERIRNDTLQLLSEIKSDLVNEWEGEEPTINFWLLLAALVVCIAYIVFAIFYFSRVCGFVASLVLSSYFKLKVRIGSLSISVLSGKLMFRNVSYTDSDISVHINDGWIILSYWIFVPKERHLPKVMDRSRFHVSINGLRVHLYNRLGIYKNLFRSTDVRQAAARVLGEADVPVAPKPSKIVENKETLFEKLWRFTGAIKVDVSSGRLIAGNHTMPTAFACVFENMHSRVMLTDSSNKQDKYMLRMRSTMENVRVSIIRSHDYEGNFEDPPRTMGDGFAVLQSASIQLYYHQDILEKVSGIPTQSPTEDIPVWESIWRLDSNTVFSYGPWADKQRAMLYSFFFPSDMATAPITAMPEQGKSRIFLQHDVRVMLVKDATMDFWFMRMEELNSLHMGVKQGSSFEFSVPWITNEAGFTSSVKGSLLCAELTTTLPFRNFIECETMRFHFSCQYPRTYNAHQNWHLSLELHKFSTWVVWDHKRFFNDMIAEWTSDSVSDLRTFVPYTVSFNINVMDRFEIILLLNEKNWVDTSSTTSAENFLAAIVGSHLSTSFALPFTDFAPKTIPVDFDFSARERLALRVHVPQQFVSEPVFSSLMHSAHYKAFRAKSGIVVGVSDDWLELWRTETVTMKFGYVFHPVPSYVKSDLPDRCLAEMIPPDVKTPAALTPDSLKSFIDIGDSEVFFSGIIIKMFLDFKDNYFSSYDQTSDVSNKPLHSARMKARERQPPEYYRPMNVIFRLEVHNIRAHCLVHSPRKAIDAPPDACPILFTEHLAVEMQKCHAEAIIQCGIGPTIAYFPASTTFSPGAPEGWVSLSALQFRGHGLYSDVEVPWEIEVVEYAWLMELVLGDLSAKLHPMHLLTLVQFIESLLLLVVNPDESLEIPDRLDMCHHYENIRTCSKGGLNVIDLKGRKQNCESSEMLKYKLIRVSVDSVDLLAVEERCALQIKAERVRVCFCNAHAGSFSENVVLLLPVVRIKQLIKVVDKKIWLECGFAKVQNISLDVRLPCTESSAYLLSGRREFLQKHDKPLPRLYFLWDRRNKYCGCFGVTRFFAEKDRCGPAFILKPEERLAVPSIVTTPGEQHGFLQSIIHHGVTMLQVDLPSSDFVRSTTPPVGKPVDDVPRRTSDASFHSAKSGFNTPPSFVCDYAAFLDNYDLLCREAPMPAFTGRGSLALWIVDYAAKISKTVDGITDVQLVKKPTAINVEVTTPVALRKQSSLAKTPSTPTIGPTMEAIMDADWGKDTTALYVRGKAGDKLNLFVSPLAVEATGSVIRAISGYLTSQHPAYIVQSVYDKCTSHHHAQPLTATITRLNDPSQNLPKTPSVHLYINLPDAHVAAFQCQPVENGRRSFAASVVLFSMERSILTATTTSKPSDDRKIAMEWRIRQTHLQMLHAVESNRYDSVYNKIPVDYETNWAELAASTRVAGGAKLKAIFDLHIPEIECRLTVCNLLKVNIASTQMDNVDIEIASVQVTSVLGKPFDVDDPSDDASFYEVLAPTLNAWIFNCAKLIQDIEAIGAAKEEWRDLTFIRLLAEGLDWHEEQVQMPEPVSALASVKLYHRNFSSCPSCKLMLMLLKFIATKTKDSHAGGEYYTRTMTCASHFDNQETRKLAMKALLSHWQTVLCPQIILPDKAVAAKYRCLLTTNDNNPHTASATTTTTPPVATSPTGALVSPEPIPTATPATPLPKNGDAVHVQTPAIVTPGATLAVEGANISNKKPPLVRVATSSGFQPGHRRGASTATRDLSTGGNENQPLDLYHWILKAHKEYKERKDPITGANDGGPVDNINAMEVMLSVFFWSFYEERKLESSRLDSFPLSQWGLRFKLHLAELNVDVIEKKLLLSPRNEMLVALTRHHLMALESFEIEGQLFYEIHMDDHELKPVQAYLDVKYDSKINKIRFEIALASVSFINDLAMSIVSCQNAVRDVTDALKRAPTRSSTQSLTISAPAMHANANATDNTSGSGGSIKTAREEEWTDGVFEKLYYYKKSPYNLVQQSNLFQTHFLGAWHIKTIMLESMLTDLRVSMNLMKIELDHDHCREDYSHGDSLPGGIKPRKYSFASAPGQTAPTKPRNGRPLMDSVLFVMKRASLIVSEHIGSNRSAVETKRILNCSLRESNVVFEREMPPKKPLTAEDIQSPVAPTPVGSPKGRNVLRVTLGEIEGDLPMHAQSIHEVVLRHGPQLNEQLHRIVSQPQPYHPLQASTVSTTTTDGPFVTAPAISSANLSTTTTLGGQQKQASTSTLPPPIRQSTQLAVPPATIGAGPLGGGPSEMEIDFELTLVGLELNAMLLPSLKAKYRLDKALAQGTTGSSAKFSAEMCEHQLLFLVVKPAGPGHMTVPSAPVDTFTLALPKIKASGNLISASVAAAKSPEMLHRYRNPMLTFREGAYYDIELVMGKMEYTFSTDLLNQILFAEQSFRSELSFLLEKLSVEKPTAMMTSNPAGTPFAASAPLLFHLHFRGEDNPWVQLTASTPSRTAIRFTIDGPNASITNRLTLLNGSSEMVMPDEEVNPKVPEQLFFGKASVQVNVKLGQLFKTAMYEEAPEELQEVATFMTNIAVQNEESSHASPHNYVILLNRPILLLKSTALDKAILLWLNYRNVHNYWREERQRILAQQNRAKTSTSTPIQPKSAGKSESMSKEKPSSSAATTSKESLTKSPHTPAATPTTNPATAAPSTTDINLNLSLSIQNGFYVCVPLTSADLSDNSAALVISLKKSDVTVCIKKELACNANFDGFQITFIDNIDEDSLREPWMQDNAAGGSRSHGNSMDSTVSNFFYFPHGSYKLCSSAYSASSSEESAKWYLSVKSEMKGMVIDFDPKIGKLMSLFAHTLSSLGDNDDGAEDYAPSEMSTVLVPTEDSPKHGNEVLDDETSKEFRRVVGHENKVRWLEKKMHEQSMLVADLSAYGVDAPSVEVERRKLRVLELMRFKEFRQTMLEKLKRKTTVVRDAKPKSNAAADSTKTAKLPTTPFLQAPGAVSAVKQRDSAESHTGSETDITERENAPNKSGVKAANVEESVDINIDVQINIETGKCILRANPPANANPQSGGGAMTKRPSTRDLKNIQSITQLAIPSVDVKVFYTSNDSATAPPEAIRNIFKEQMRQRKSVKNNCFYLALELASMPDESLVTPLLADFLEQVIEPLPESLFETAKPDEDETSNSNAVPIVALDTSGLPLDVLFHMVVQSSRIRFEGQQQRSSAADCLLKLPRLALMASTRKYNEQATAVGGIYLSATLSAFSLSVYSPHQQATAHDALSLTLDKLAISASRVKNPTEEEKNKVQLVIVCNVGAANFNYDMRRLSELLAFPKPWYRKVLVRRLFFGDQSVTVRRTAASSGHSSQLDLSNVSGGGRRGSVVKALKHKSDSATTTTPIDWAATCVFTMQWKELNVKAQMSNTMGNTSWIARDGLLRGHLQIRPKRCRDCAVTFKLAASQLSAQGGAVSGEISISKLFISARHIRSEQKAPENTAKLEFSNIESRVEWMSRPIFIGKFLEPCIVVSDEWRYTNDSHGNVIDSKCVIHVAGSWTDLQMIITKMTIDDMIKISKKLHTFFDEQLKNSRLMWFTELEQQRRDALRRRAVSIDLGSASRSERAKSSDELSLESTIGSEGGSLNSSFQNKSVASTEPYLDRHWHRVLDNITQIQLTKDFFPLPSTADGITLTGGSIELEAKSISVACMNGEMTAPSWALFHLRQVSVFVKSDAKYAYLDQAKTNVGVALEQKFMLKLGNASPTTPVEHNECKAVVCRVQHGRNFILRNNASVETWLDSMIGDAIRQLNFFNDTKEASKFAHNVLELFQFPALEAVLTTKQSQDNDPGIEQLEIVESSFLSEFHNYVSIQTDFNAQVGFLPELLKSYSKSSSDVPMTTDGKERLASAKTQDPKHPLDKDTDEKRDPRKFECLTWVVNPSIRFIDRFVWNPPVIDDILRKLQIFDHRRTIPKVMQRGVLDRCDALLAALLEHIVVKLALKE
uniref:FSA_C domain-containing protein n=1 Tax=Panagrellus redivivus TaxID=6233 RepID=A0A7E4VU99_PANRE